MRSVIENAVRARILGELESERSRIYLRVLGDYPGILASTFAGVTTGDIHQLVDEELDAVIALIKARSANEGAGQ